MSFSYFMLIFRYSDILLRRVSAGHICFSSTLKSFVSLTAEGAIPFNAEEFTDPSELRALTELIGINFDPLIFINVPKKLFSSLFVHVILLLFHNLLKDNILSVINWQFDSWKLKYKRNVILIN
jgi:hypothetical protein